MSSELPAARGNPENDEAGDDVEPDRGRAKPGGSAERIDRLESIVTEQTATISALVSEIHETNRWLKRLVSEKNPVAPKSVPLGFEVAGPTPVLEQEAVRHYLSPNLSEGTPDHDRDQMIEQAVDVAWKNSFIGNRYTGSISNRCLDWLTGGLGVADGVGQCWILARAPEFQSLLGASLLQVSWSSILFRRDDDHIQKEVGLMKAHIEQMWLLSARIFGPGQFRLDTKKRWSLQLRTVGGGYGNLLCSWFFQGTGGRLVQRTDSSIVLNENLVLASLPVGAFWAVTVERGHIALSLISRLASYVFSESYTDSDHCSTPSSSSDIATCFIDLLLGFVAGWESFRRSLTADVEMDLTRIIHPIRVFSPGFGGLPGEVEGFGGSDWGGPALKYHRETGNLPHLEGGLGTRFIERRVSVLFASKQSAGTENDGSASPLNFKIMLFRDHDRSPHPWAEGYLDWEKRGFTVRGVRSGFMLFQAILHGLLVEWGGWWRASLDEIDDCVKVKLISVLNKRTSEGLMFDNSFRKSRVYFQALQVLRIFSENIRETGADLRSLRIMVEKTVREGYRDIDIRNNWKIILDFQAQEEKKLLQRIAEKTEEIKSLRDGLFNATSLLEASKSTTMNRYIIVFTIVTVLYLPPSFVATVFGTDLFNSDDTDGTITKFKFTTVAVSLITYLFAFFLVWLAGRMNSVRKLRTYLRKKLSRLVLRFRMSPSKVEPGEDQDSEIQLHV